VHPGVGQKLHSSGGIRALGPCTQLQMGHTVFPRSHGKVLICSEGPEQASISTLRGPLWRVNQMCSVPELACSMYTWSIFLFCGFFVTIRAPAGTRSPHQPGADIPALIHASASKKGHRHADNSGDLFQLPLKTSLQACLGCTRNRHIVSNRDTDSLTWSTKVIREGCLSTQDNTCAMEWRK
jgi:hypothetical protein